MAKATGFYCDYCKTFETTQDTHTPIGWLRLTVRTTEHDPHGGFDLCSNKCLTAFARERLKAERGDEPKSSSGTSNGTSRSGATPITDEGLTRVPGLIDQYLRSGDDQEAQDWWASYADGYRVTAGRGYSWFCELGEKEQRQLADYLAVLVQAIHDSPETQTVVEKRFIDAAVRFTEAVRAELSA